MAKPCRDQGDIRMSANGGPLRSFSLQVLAFLWAMPYTLLGLGIGVIGLCSGGHVQVRGRIIEFHGGFVKRFLTWLPGGLSVLAITFGHVVLGQTDVGLDIARPHEMIHVRQYERWGPFMGPAYLLCSLVLWLRGRRPYRDNPFEREAYNKAGCD
jgi:hypothetical protein